MDVLGVIVIYDITFSAYVSTKNIFAKFKEYLLGQISLRTNMLQTIWNVFVSLCKVSNVYVLTTKPPISSLVISIDCLRAIFLSCCFCFCSRIVDLVLFTNRFVTSPRSLELRFWRRKRQKSLLLR